MSLMTKENTMTIKASEPNRTTALAELACAARRLRRQLTLIPADHRPEPAEAFADLEAARLEVIELTRQGRDDEARAIVNDWAHTARERIAAKLAHAPHEVTR